MNRRVIQAKCYALLLAFTAPAWADEIDDARQAFLDGDHAAALEILLPAAEAGNANAQNIVAIAYDNGRGLAVDKTKARAWYEKSAGQGFAKAQFNLGLMLMKGEGEVAADPARAAELYEQAMAQEFAPAFLERGRMYRDGIGGKVDLDAARATYERGLALGDGKSGLALADMYRLGTGVEKDEEKARAIYVETAATGYSVAIGNLALMHERGMGGPVELATAYALYREAVSLGDGNAAINLADFLVHQPGYWQSKPMGWAYCLKGIDLAREEQAENFRASCEALSQNLTDEEQAEGERIGKGGL